MEIVLLIAVILMVLVIAILLWYWLSIRHMQSKASITAVIEFPVDVPAVVNLSPIDADDLTMIKFSLLHAAKIHHVLQECPNRTGEFLTSILQESTSSGKGKMFDYISDFLEQLESKMKSEGLPRANGNKERYVAWLYEGATSFVNTELPVVPRGMAMNTPLSVLLVADYVAKRISDRNRFIFESALREFIERLASKSSKVGLLEFQGMSLTAFERAKNHKEK